MGADRVKSFALEWDGNTYLFEGGKIVYEPEEDREDFQYSSLVHDFQLDAIDMYFTIFCGYLDQQLNAGSGYQLQDGTNISSAPSVGVVDILNALLASNITPVYFCPVMEANDGSVYDEVKYQVLSNNARFALIEAERAGRFNPYLPVRMKVKTPLSAYPAWGNR